jgi:hypothetical protein
MSITEDELVDSLIKWEKEHTDTLEDLDNTSINLKINPEASYNHYGNRGFVDLFTEKKYPQGYSEAHAFELKSESAVREVTGANEIVRQFNKMREYFFKGSNYNVPKDLVFELCFTPTESNIRHILKNIEVYESITNQELLEKDIKRKKVLITVRPTDKDNITPIIFTSSGQTPVKDLDFDEYAKNSNEVVYQKHKDLFSEITEKHVD